MTEEEMRERLVVLEDALQTIYTNITLIPTHKIKTFIELTLNKE